MAASLITSDCEEDGGAFNEYCFVKMACGMSHGSLKITAYHLESRERV